MNRQHSTLLACAALCLGIGLVGCGGSSGGGSAGADPNATLAAGQYDATLKTNCGGESDTDSGTGEIIVNGNQVTLEIEDLGTLGPATLDKGKIEIPAFSFRDNEDGADVTVNAFTLNLTADNKLSGNFTFNWDDGEDECDGTGSISIS